MTDIVANEAVNNETSNETISTDTATAAPVEESYTLPAKFKDVKSLIQSYEHLESKLGAAKEPEMDEATMLAKLGKPDSPEGYHFEHEENSGITQDDIQALVAEAHELGLTNKQAQALLDKKVALLKEVGSLSEERTKASTAFLKEKFGVSYDERMAAAQNAIDTIKRNYGEHAESLINSGVMSNPAMVAMLADIGHAAQEKSMQGTMKNSSFHLTPEYAAKELDKLQKDPEFLDKYLNGRHPEHAKAVETMTKLTKMKLGVN